MGGKLGFALVGGYMYLLYCDESGDSGHSTNVTRFYTTVGIIVRDHSWNDCLKKLKVFRKQLQRNYGISPGAELHATEIWNGRGNYRRLSRSQRKTLLRDVLVFVRTLSEVKIIVVTAEKASSKLRGKSIFETTWKYFFQRYENFLKKEGEFGLVLPDKGNEGQQRRILRRMRVYNPIPSKFGKYYRQEIVKILEDPSVRESSLSYFVQLADIVAYVSRLRDDASKSHRFWKLQRLFTLLKPVYLTAANRQDSYGFVYIK